MELPLLPASLPNFIPYLDANSNTIEALKPYRVFEGKLREVFAQEAENPAIADHHVNTVPLFDGHEHLLKVRARQLENESIKEREKYLLPLPEKDRKQNVSPAIVGSIKEFKANFSLFSESSLADLNWSNVVAAGSSVATSLLPVNAPNNESKRALRSYYHEKLAPASDVDLFLYGLTEEQAIEKIKQIETNVRDAILEETTTIRTKNTITIVSAYPTRHVQIVLRIYKSVSEILTGFDVDCACVAYDGSQVFATPRAVAAYITQVNTIDLTRRSPSYENRLSKYSHRGFEVYWPEIDRSRIDPTIFERSFSRVLGLARLLVLEKLPSPTDRDNYLAMRRAERGRPPSSSAARHINQLPGNLKDAQPDEVPEWVEEDDVSNYHTFTIPYGAKYTAKKIESILFTKDLLLNAEWNKARDREADLHRHPAFFGSVNDVIGDCCGFCPEPTTDADFAVAEEESKIYISGNVGFLKDDPGRQSIGSFNPITEDDWTEMAYVGNTARLCQAIVDCDLEHVKDWCDQEGSDVNQRDYTGRAPLHLAASCSTLEIVQCLIDHGARLVARVYDGSTALHIAALRGHAGIVKALLDKSESNEEEEARKEDQKKEARRAANAQSKARSESASKHDESPDEIEDEGDVLGDDGSDESDQMTEGSFVKVRDPEVDDMPQDSNADEPDFYNVDVLAWDSPVSPLHLAILAGKLEVMELLVSTYGADVLLPIKLFHDYDRKRARAAVLSLTLSLQLPVSEAVEITKKLLSMGASSLQADMNHVTALHSVVNSGNTDVVDALFELDGPAASKALDQLVVGGWREDVVVNTPLLTAIGECHTKMADHLLQLGSKPVINFENFAQAYHRTFEDATTDPDEIKKIFDTSVTQPIVKAASSENPRLVQKLLDMGASPNSLNNEGYPARIYPYSSWQNAGTVLDLIQRQLKKLKRYHGEKRSEDLEAPEPFKNDKEYVEGLQRGTYRFWLADHDLRKAKMIRRIQLKQYRKTLESPDIEAENAKLDAVKDLTRALVELEEVLLKRGAKSFYELFPEIEKPKSEKDYAPYYPYGERPNDKPYETVQNFLLPDLTPAKKDGYFQLFQAAWEGDISLVKALTLGEWGSGQRPLQIAVSDIRGFNAFSLAVLRGHFDLAKTILDISTAQYQPEKKTNYIRYSMRRSQTAEESDDGGSNGDDRISVFGELVDEVFTIDDIGALAGNVKSKTSPLQMVNRLSEAWSMLDDVSVAAVKDDLISGEQDVVVYHNEPESSWAYFHKLFEVESTRCRWSLIRFAIAKNDIDLLKFILGIGVDLAAQEQDAENPKPFTVSSSDFNFAVRLGRTLMVGEIIKATGAAIPLQKLVKKSGVQVKESPRYYQGLTVHGKKRKDWADARRGLVSTSVENGHPPALSAIFRGNLDSIKYFLGEGPLRNYHDFAATHKHDKRIQTLSQTEGGMDKMLTTWLGVRRTLSIHMAVMSDPREDGSNPALDFLIETMPEALESKASDGTTPLHLAFELKRYLAARTLIAAGADQTTRNAKSENICHAIIKSYRRKPEKMFSSALSLLDPRLLKPMFLERCGGTDPGSLTPLALYIHTTETFEGIEELWKAIFSYTKGKDLEMMDGAGDYPLHVLVRKNLREAARFIIDFNPNLLYMENATGMTPPEIAENRRLRELVEYPPVVQTGNSIGRFFPIRLLNKTPQQFVKKPKSEDEAEAEVEASIWQLCNKKAQAYPRKRKLVSLFDANEVAKRLALAQQEEKNKKSKTEGGGEEHEDEEDEQERNQGDEVVQWRAEADGFRKYDLELFQKEANPNQNQA